MLGGHNNRVRAVDRVHARREHTHTLVRVLDRKINERAGTFADPVALHRQHALGPAAFDLLHVIQQSLRVVGRADEPLLQIAFLHRRAATPTDAARRLLVRQHRLFLRTPIHRRVLTVDQPALQHLQEEPLIPLVVFGRMRRDLAPPVEAEAHALELRAHVRDILFRPLARMYVAFDRSLLGRLPETVPTHRMDHVAALQAFVPRQRIAD